MKQKNLKKLFVTPFTVCLFILVLSGYAFAQWGNRGGWEMGPGMMGGWGYGGFGMIFMVVTWVLVIVGLVFLIRWLVHATKSDSGNLKSGSRALEILKERYAKGEIEKEEFEAKKKDLMI